MSFYGPQLVSEAIAASPRLVLLGEPGSGKSTALRFLALRSRAPGWTRQRTWPRCSKGGACSAPAAGSSRCSCCRCRWLSISRRRRTTTAAPPTCGRRSTTPGPQRRDRRSHHGDACRAGARPRAAAADGWTRSRARSAPPGDRRGAGLAAEQPQCRMVACRVRAYEGAQNSAWQLPGWPAATLADWTRGQMEQFVAAWYAAVVAAGGLAEQRRTERVQSLQRAISAREDSQRLGVRPLLLTIMALVHLNDGRPSEDRVSLCAAASTSCWRSGNSVARTQVIWLAFMDYVGLPNSGSTALRPLLARAAFAAHEAAKPGEVGRPPGAAHHGGR
ncbi:MAG: hypothetical protein U0Z44_16010 [Kouleothrix sp.]